MKGRIAFTSGLYSFAVLYLGSAVCYQLCHGRQLGPLTESHAKSNYYRRRAHPHTYPSKFQQSTWLIDNIVNKATCKAHKFRLVSSPSQEMLHSRTVMLCIRTTFCKQRGPCLHSDLRRILAGRCFWLSRFFVSLTTLTHPYLGVNNDRLCIIYTANARSYG